MPATMNQALEFKILQRQLKFRNPDHLLQLPGHRPFTQTELNSATKYLDQLNSLGIKFTYPGDPNYPRQFFRMKEPPLFLEYKGDPFWKTYDCLSVVGSRKIHALTESWMAHHLSDYMALQQVCIVSGGAFGVDQAAHVLALKKGLPTVAVVPSGLVDIYPSVLEKKLLSLDPDKVCFLSEFEIQQKLHKSHFYYRNRLISALGDMVLVTQADLKSGSFLTVHHALENGRPVFTLPSHPQLIGFNGNLKLLQDGAGLITNSLDLLQFWNAENLSKQMLLTLD